MIEITPYQSSWPSEFQAIAAILRQALGDLAVRIDHIGSTAVPGLPAKDIIDVQISVNVLDERIVAAMTSLGYSLPEGIWRDHRPPNAVGPEADWDKLFFRGPRVDAARTPTCACRDAPINASRSCFGITCARMPATAEAYAELKRRLAMHLADLETYSDVKDPAVDLIYFAAEDWAAATQWQLGPPDA